MRATDHDAFNQEQQNEAGNDDTASFKTLQFWVDRRNAVCYPESRLSGTGDPGDPAGALLALLETRLKQIIRLTSIWSLSRLCHCCWL